MENINFGKRFKELREIHNLTQEQLAEKLGIEAQQISRIETGRCFTTLENLKKIATLYNISIQDIFNFEHFMSKDKLIENIVDMLNKTSDSNCKIIYKIVKDIIY